MIFKIILSIAALDGAHTKIRGFALRAVANAASRDPVAFVAIRRTSS